MLKSKSAFEVQVTRGQIVENQHEIMAAFWHVTRGLIGYAGNYNYLTMPRSAIKMLQALPLIESGAFDYFKLTEPMLALACASHKAEKVHLDLLKEWSGLTGITEKNLACGAQPNALYNNCSGKHFGFLTTCLFLKDKLEGYVEESHPQQRRVRQVLNEALGIDLQKSPWGIDGCGIPTYGVPLQKWAQAMCLLMDTKTPPKRRDACHRILHACQRYPELLSGADEWPTQVMKMVPGKVLLKTGADGVLCGLLPQEQMSFALKCLDGDSRAVQAQTFEILKYYGILSDTQLSQLIASTGLEIQNTLGQKVGVVRVLTKNN